MSWLRIRTVIAAIRPREVRIHRLGTVARLGSVGFLTKAIPHRIFPHFMIQLQSNVRDDGTVTTKELAYEKQSIFTPLTQATNRVPPESCFASCGKQDQCAVMPSARPFLSAQQYSSPGVTRPKHNNSHDITRVFGWYGPSTEWVGKS